MWRHFNVISAATTQRPIPLHFRQHRQTMENTIRYQPEVETVPQIGSTNNLATETDIDAISMAIPMFWDIVSLVHMSTLPNISFTQKFQAGGRIPEVVITLRQKMIPRWSQRLWQCFRASPIHLHQHQHCSTRDNTIRCKPEVETVPKTGSTN